MIPLKLRIKNFVSYGAQQEIDFEPYNLICLSGKNGHGKSALLDALTWVLWGQARKIGGAAKADEGLLRLGQTHMMVSLDFSSNNVMYRVKRDYTVAANKAQSNLEFGILETETQNLKPLTDKTIRATQEKIIQTIGLDYDSFINSAFLRQGQANEFSKKSPKDRKEILATILGLDRFENIRRLALDKVTEASNQKDQAHAARERLTQEHQKLPALENELRSVEAQLQELIQKEKTFQLQAHDIAKKKEALAVQKAQSEKILFQKQHLEKTVDEQRHQILEMATLWRRTAKQQRSIQVSDRGQLIEQQKSFQTQLHELQIQAARRLQLKEEYLVKREAFNTWLRTEQELHKQTEKNLLVQEQTLLLHIKNTTDKKEELVQKNELLMKELLALEKEQLQLSVQEPAPTDLMIKNAESALERRKGYYHNFLSRLQSLQGRVESVNRKKQFIGQTEEAQCPLCDQKADKSSLLKKFGKEEHLYAHQYNRLAEVIKTLKTKLIEEHNALELLKKKAMEAQMALLKKNEFTALKKKILVERERIEEEIKRSDATITQLQSQKDICIRELGSIANKTRTITETPQYQQMSKEITDIEQAVAKIPYDQSKEKEAQEKLNSITMLISEQASLMQEIARQEERKQSIHLKCEHVGEIKKQITFLASNPVPLDTFSQEIEKISSQERELAQLFQEVTRQKEQLIHQKGTGEAQYAALKKIEKELETTEQILKQVTREVEDYTAIALSLGKDGIQALLIEDVIPEIEQEANDLLTKLTDNQAHLSIESLRDLRSGKTKETLDIKISDAIGVRPYELFSGGEAFRIDFALRIAISKLLARRAGAALQTLIIDEGFGSQDEEGLSHMMEALYSIQEDFAKVIIVSHLPSMKEQFPVHFSIIKTADGSSVNVIEHC